MNVPRAKHLVATVVLAVLLIPLITGCGNSGVKNNTNEEIPKGQVEKVELISFHRSTR